MSDPNEIVGHKTIATGKIGHSGFPEHRHEPLTRAEADEIWERVEAERKARAEAMPTEGDAVKAMWSAYQRLRELGWRNAAYLSSEKNGTMRLITPGSSGIHEGHYSGEWNTGSWLIHDSGDLWPANPCLAKPLEPTHEAMSK